MSSVRFAQHKKALLAVAVVTSQLLPLRCLPALALSAIRVAGQQAFIVDAGSGGMSPAQRAATIQRNIDNALYAISDRSPAAVGVSYVNKQPVITLGGFYVASVDAASAKKAGLTTSVLAQRWASGLKRALSNRAAVNTYVAKLSATPEVAQNTGTTTTDTGSYPYFRQGRVVYIPAGMTIPVTLSTSLSSEMARTGDPIEARISQTVNLGDAVIPQDSVIIGQVTEAVPGQRMSHSGHLGLKFTKLRTPDGTETPITAHIIGGIQKYGEIGTNSDLYQGETFKTKATKAAVHGAIGAGAGALLGTTIGAIASHGYGTGRGAWSGAALGGALGVAESLLLRKGSDVKIQPGENLTLQLDAPASIAVTSGNL
jgi:hypothetical protein